MHTLVVLCDHYGPAQVERFRAAIADGALVTQGHVPTVVTVAAAFEERPWEGAIERALAEYASQDRHGHLLYIRGWAVLDLAAVDRLARSAGPMYGTRSAFADFIVYGPSDAANVGMVLREAQIGMIDHESFDQSVLEATSAAGLYQVARVEAYGRDRQTLVRHADGTALAFHTEAEVQAALASLVPTSASDLADPPYRYRAIAPTGPGMPPVPPLGLTAALAAQIARILPAKTLPGSALLHGVILTNGTALIRLEDHAILWFVLTSAPQAPETPASHEDDPATEDVLAFLDQHEPEIATTISHISAHHTAAAAEPFALTSSPRSY